MSSDRCDEVVAEYLRELEQRLGGLPVLQRRELLGDLEAHIVNERAERGVTSETELLVVLERLGSPEVVAAAAYEEAGLPEPTVELAPAGAAPRAASGTLTVAASARFTGRAERTAALGSEELFGAAGARPASPAPLQTPPAPKPASAAPVQAYAPPSFSAAVVPPPDDLLRERPGPFPPGGGHLFPSGPGGRPWSDAPPPPFVGGPPFAPPPPRREPSSRAWVRAAVGAAIAFAVVVMFGCLAGAFLLQTSSVDEAPAAVSVEAPDPVDLPPVPPVPLPTE
ncbi:HAAS signaling domain-containing protein [Actinoplanes sp. NPDC049316]|uniref:HAAS signaling domain-containing protein n=1 Tax=Actinoplanes sp. NPDC049316 TaxID=3154727 RepID=UPI00343C1C02